MTPEMHVVSPGRARINRLRWWWLRRMGWHGALALLLLVVSAILEWGVRPEIARTHTQMLHDHVARLDALARTRPLVSSANPRDPRDQLRDVLPSVHRRGESVAALLELLEHAKVAADRAEYTAEDQEPGLVRLRVSLPVQGGYAPTRQLIASILNAMPNAALDRVELARPAALGNNLAGQLHLSLFFRSEAP